MVLHVKVLPWIYWRISGGIANADNCAKGERRHRAIRTSRHRRCAHAERGAQHIDQVDLIGNDSGGGIAQIFAAHNPGRVRSLTLTNCDAHDNWPPTAFGPFVEMIKAGGLRGTLNAMLAEKAIFRSPGALGPAYERPETVTDEDIEAYLRPLVRTDERTRDLQRFVVAFDNKHTRRFRWLADMKTGGFSGNDGSFSHLGASALLPGSCPTSARPGGRPG